MTEDAIYAYWYGSPRDTFLINGQPPPGRVLNLQFDEIPGQHRHPCRIDAAYKAYPGERVHLFYMDAAEEYSYEVVASYYETQWDAEAEAWRVRIDGPIRRSSRAPRRTTLAGPL